MGIVTNMALMPLEYRIETAEDVKEFVVAFLEQIWQKPILFARIMLVEKLRNPDGGVVFNAEREELEQAFAMVDATFYRRDGKTRMNVVQTTFGDNKDIIQQTLNLVVADADVKDLLTHLVNILNVLLPPEPDHDSANTPLIN